jgi:hypothetical protein
MKEETMHMDCTQFEEVLADLDRPGTRGAALRESALVHAESCSRCADLLNESESLDFSLRSLATHDANREAPPRVEAAVLQRFRQEKRFAARRRLQWQFSILGAAAAALLALGLALHHGFLPGLGPAPSSSAVDESDNAAAFTPLPYADDPATINEGAVVRVVLSSSALASLGVPVTNLADTDRIPADLVVSADGTPQAIRLVSQVN